MSNDRSQWTQNETLKVANPTLTGSIPQTLADASLDRFSNDDTQFLKFHGIYQQDDRDLRKTGKKFMFMIRGRLPGGLVPPDVFLVFDRLASDHGNNTLRITSRQGFQFHGVVKSGLGPLMKGINEALSTTLAACGDVNRNVMAPPTPATGPLMDSVHDDARLLSDALLPSTRAYHQIWVEGTLLDLNEDPDFEDPLYGKTYLPRKFKTAFAIPPLNDSDVLTNCLGFIAIGEGDRLEGYNLAVGGGMGMTHGNKETFPRLADVVGFFKRDMIESVAKAVLMIHRDHGDRTNRKHARLKYVLEDKGVEWFRQELEKRVGFALEPAREANFTKQGDLFGWHPQPDGRWFLGLYVPTGRVKDVEGGARLKSALREIASRCRTEMRLTPTQNLLLVNVAEAEREVINQLLATHDVPVEDQATLVELASMACPALPTCGLALAESERVLPDIMSRLNGLLAEVGLPGSEVIVRMTGCPNGCVRPFMAELGIVGRAPNKYHLYLGGNESNTRMNRIFKENVRNEDILETLRPVFRRYAAERKPDERLGDWCARTLWTENGGGAD